MAIDEKQKQLWVNELKLNGFIVLRDFLPVDLVQAMHTDLLPLLEAEHAKALQDNYSQGRGPGRLALHLGPYIDLMQGALADERYRKNPIVEELVDAVMEPGGWDRGWTVVEAVWQGSVHMGWHSDQGDSDTPDVRAQPSTMRMTFNIPLVDFSAANGGTEFLPGSHMLPVGFHEGVEYETLDNVYPVLPELRRGDAILRDGNALHRGTPNSTDAVRPMLDQTYKKRI